MGNQTHDHSACSHIASTNYATVCLVLVNDLIAGAVSKMQLLVLLVDC
jgi:hypothetical protein